MNLLEPGASGAASFGVSDFGASGFEASVFAEPTGWDVGLGEQAERPATRTATTAIIIFMLITIGNTGIDWNYSRARKNPQGLPPPMAPARIPSRVFRAPPSSDILPYFLKKGGPLAWCPGRWKGDRAMGGAFSLSHVILVVFVIVLLFGAHKIPELMRSLGSGLTEFKRGMDQGPKESKDLAELPKT